MSRKTKANAAKEEAKLAATLAPKLRFPEFRGLTGWNADKLVQVADFVNEKANVAKVAPENYVSTEGILPDYAGIAGASKLPATGVVTRFKPNDTLVSNIRPYLKKVWVADREGGASNDVIVIRAKQAVLPEYLACLLKNDAFIDYVMTGAKGVKMPRGDIGSMKEYPTPYPSPAEQQKIAECLRWVDELMAAQARKVDVLKTHKKGLMQQLFPREGETQPRLRFPEFQNTGEWEEAELGQRITIKGRIGYRGYTVEDIVNAGEGAISLSPSNITDSGVLGFEKTTYISWAKYHESPEIMVETGQTLLVKTGSTFGKTAYVSDLPQACTVNPQIVVLKPHSIHPYFLFLLVFGEVIQTKIRAIVVGGAIPTMSQEGVSKFKIRIPKPAEQQRVAECLRSLDALITAATQKHEALMTHKKGLMQHLFPSPEGQS